MAYTVGEKSLLCYREPTREDPSDTVYSLLKVFIPVIWDYTQVFGNQG